MASACAPNTHLRMGTDWLVDAGWQDVTSLQTPEAVLSSAHQSASHQAQGSLPKVQRVVELEREDAADDDGKGGDVGDGGHGQQQVALTPLTETFVSELGEAVVSVVYAGVPFVLKIPPGGGLWGRVSYIADRILAHPSNEALVKAVIQHESLLPCPVARTQVTLDPARCPCLACAVTGLHCRHALQACTVGALGTSCGRLACWG